MASESVPTPGGSHSPAARIQVPTVTIMLPLHWLFSQTLSSQLPEPKVLDSYQLLLPFIHCPWGTPVLSTEWPLGSDLPRRPHHNCSTQVLIMLCLNWFIPKFPSTPFTPSILLLFGCHILLTKTKISYHYTATNLLEIPSVLTPTVI